MLLLHREKVIIPTTFNTLDFFFDFFFKERHSSFFSSGVSSDLISEAEAAFARGKRVCTNFTIRVHVDLIDTFSLTAATH